MRVREHGAAGGKLAIGVPGLSANCFTFNLLGPAVAELGRTLAAVDLRGRGRSAPGKLGSHGWAAHARDVLAVADALGAQRFDFIGHSMGAFVGLALMAIAPMRVRSLVLIDAVGVPDPRAMPPIMGAAQRLGAVYPSVDAFLALVKGIGVVPVEPQRSVYVEGARGCRSKCTFCFYPKAESGLRLLDPSQVEALVTGLREHGAKELSFLDPTFNHRPDFEAVLEALIRANPKREMSFFAEVRPEGLSAKHAAMLAQAGFTKLEIGLQSVSAKTLKRVKRGGNPAMVAAAAKLMRSEGLDLLLDLIVGLPGDTADDVARGVDYLEKHQLGAFAQVFALFVLPGTAMRDTALDDGLVFEPEPPYRIIRTATMDEQAIADALASAEERLGRRLDERPRPHLVERGTARDVFHLDLDAAGSDARREAARPGGQHVALWLEADDLFSKQQAVLDAIGARQTVDPYATLDVVLVPSQPFPLDLLDAVAAKLDSGMQSYATRALKHRSGDAVHRITVVLKATTQVPHDWVEAVMEQVQVFRDQPLTRALADASELGDTLPSARIVGPVDATRLPQLEADVDPECVIFADRELETRWQRTVLGYGDAGN